MMMMLVVVLVVVVVVTMAKWEVGLTSVSMSLMFEVGWEGGRLARLVRLMAPTVSLSPSSLPAFTSARSLSVSAMLSVSS